VDIYKPCYTLYMIDEKHLPDVSWLAEWRENPLAGWLITLLDVCEPLVPIGSQLLWVVQPGLSGLIAREKLTALATALETAEGIALVRRYLGDE
jgi:hypothetical protein